MKNRLIYQFVFLMYLSLGQKVNDKLNDKNLDSNKVESSLKSMFNKFIRDSFFKVKRLHLDRKNKHSIFASLLDKYYSDVHTRFLQKHSRNEPQLERIFNSIHSSINQIKTNTFSSAKTDSKPNSNNHDTKLQEKLVSSFSLKILDQCKLNKCSEFISEKNKQYIMSMKQYLKYINSLSKKEFAKVSTLTLTELKEINHLKNDKSTKAKKSNNPMLKLSFVYDGIIVNTLIILKNLNLNIYQRIWDILHSKTPLKDLNNQKLINLRKISNNAIKKNSTVTKKSKLTPIKKLFKKVSKINKKSINIKVPTQSTAVHSQNEILNNLPRDFQSSNKFNKIITRLNSYLRVYSTSDREFDQIKKYLEEKNLQEALTNLVNQKIVSQSPDIQKFYKNEIQIIPENIVQIIDKQSKELMNHITTATSLNSMENKQKLDDIKENLLQVHLWVNNIQGNNPKILTLLNKIKNPELRKIVDMIEILKLVQTQKDFGLLQESLNKIRSFKTNELKELVKNIIQIKKQQDSSKQLELDKEIKSELSSILNENQMSAMIEDVKSIMNKQNMSDLALIKKQQKRDDLRNMSLINIQLHSMPALQHTFCKLFSVYSQQTDVKLSTAQLQAALDSNRKDHFEKILLISQISNVSVLDLDKLTLNEMFSMKHVKKLAMLQAKMMQLYPAWPNLCAATRTGTLPNHSSDSSNPLRFAQKQDKMTAGQTNKMKAMVDDLWSSIDKQCKGMEIGVAQCQEKIFSDSLINAKMAELAEHAPKSANSSAQDMHQINMKIIDDIQASLNEPGLSSDELKRRVFEVSKLLPLNHPSNETLDSVTEFLAIQEAEELKRKNKMFGKTLDFSMFKIKNFTELKAVKVSDEMLGSKPTKFELYKAMESFRNIAAEGVIYSSKQVFASIEGVQGTRELNFNKMIELMVFENPYDPQIDFAGKTAKKIRNNYEGVLEEK